MIADVYNTTVNFDGKTMFSSSYTPFGCCCGGGMYTMNSCFGFGFNGIGGFGGLGGGLGFGLGYAAGMALLTPQVLKSIGSGLSWFGTKVIAPAATFMWNSVLKPAGIGIWNGMKWVGNTVAKGAKAVAKGVSNLWNNIFHKKSKTKKT